MNKKIISPIHSDIITIIPNIKLVPEFMQFVQWFATPRKIRSPKNQKEFAKQIRVDEDTITNWKHHPHFWPLVQQNISSWMKEGVPDVIHGLYKKACLKGHSKDVETYLRITGMLPNSSSK